MISDKVSYGVFLFDVTLGEIRYLFIIHKISQLIALFYETDIHPSASVHHFQSVFC